MSNSERYSELLHQLEQYSYQYNTLDNPSVSDAVYDGLMKELKSLEAEDPKLINPQSPTQRVGGKLLKGFEKVQHSVRMISLNDVFSHHDVQSWVKRMEKLLPGADHQYFCDIKMDGLACALIYQDGVFVQAVTRGDGSMGEDVTANVKTISSVPLKLRSSKDYMSFLRGRTEIRGEIIMLKKDFDKLNKQQLADGKQIFANPRNLAAGTIRQLDPKLVAARPLCFKAYDLLRKDPAEVPTNSYAYNALFDLGVSANLRATVFNNLSDVMRFVNDWEEKRRSLPFETDGVVIKLDDRAQYTRLGTVGKNPRGAVAYKYAAEEATTVVKDIVISLGRTGAATPVAVFDPVLVAGSTIRHASLHNADEIAKKDIRVGDTVVIYKAGDIIPQVQSVIEKLRPRNAMQFSMEKELARQYPELEFDRPDGEAVYRVKGATGPILLAKGLEHFASKSAMDIDTLGQKNVIALVESGLITDISDIYAITKEQILGIDRFASLSAEKLLSAIKSKKSPPLPRFIYGLGIRHVGTQTAIDLANKFRRLDSLGTATYKELKDVDGVGEIVAESILAWFIDDDNQNMLTKFRGLGVWPKDAETVVGPLAGKKFAVTGTLETMGRDIASERVRALGGTFQTSVAQDTDYLVVGVNVGENKLKKAAKLGTKQIDEKSFIKMLS